MYSQSCQTARWVLCISRAKQALAEFQLGWESRREDMHVVGSDAGTLVSSRL